MESPSSHTGDTITIYRYYVHYVVLLSPLHSHKVTAILGPRSGHQRPQLTSIPTKYPELTQATTKLPQQTVDLSQISSICIGPGSIISFRRSSSRYGAVIGPNRSDPQPNISNRRQGSNDLHQVASTFLARHQETMPYFPQYTPLWN